MRSSAEIAKELGMILGLDESSVRITIDLAEHYGRCQQAGHDAGEALVNDARRLQSNGVTFSGVQLAALAQALNEACDGGRVDQKKAASIAEIVFDVTRRGVS